MDLQEQIYSVLVVSSSENFNNALSPLLPVSKYDPIRFAGSVSAARRLLSERNYDFVIINSPLPDDSGAAFAVDAGLANGCIALLIVQQSILNDVHSRVVRQGVFTIAKPLSAQMFTTVLNWMASARERLRNSEKKALSFEEKMQEIRLVNRAKWLLITELKMEEPQAHRLIEKQAMDRCITRREVAAEIIKTYS